MDQPSLFTPIPPVEPSRVSQAGIGKASPSVDPVARDCSLRGALDVAPRIEAQQQRMVSAYRLMGAQTDAEMADFLGLERSSITARRAELIEAGIVIRAGVRKNPHTGISNTTWQLTEKGKHRCESSKA